VLGPRFLIQAGFIITVAIVAGIARVGTWAIIGLVAGAWLLAALVEIGLWLWSTNARATPEPEPAGEADAEAAAEREPAPLPIPETIPVPTPEPVAERPVRTEPGPVEDARGKRDVPAAQTEVPAEPQPAAARLPTNDGPREWNLWELERVAREHVTADVARNEERAYLLMYLREFAGPDGNLPADFDGLVRDAFGDLLRTAAT
jgi:hypothetical protein